MMDIEQFRRLDAAQRAERPKPFLLIPPDPPAKEAALLAVERSLGVVLPQTYKQFLTEFGGGNFGLTNVCSAHPESEFYLPKKQSEIEQYVPAGLLAVSDDFAGGVYVLRIAEGGVAQDPVLYWNIDGGLVTTPFENVLEFVARYAYRSA